MKQFAYAAIAASLFAACAVHAQVTIEWVTVGNPGNAPDPLNSGDIPGIGSVAYEYRIGKHEITNAQYAAFLNAVAASDPNGLYNPSMGSEPSGGIVRSGTDGSYTYLVKANMGDKPVNFVSWYDAARFCNWLTNGQPGGSQGSGTTEAGVYTFDGVNSVSAISRDFLNPIQVFIPTEDEWYKAAFHDASAGTAGDYFLYATDSNSVPVSDNPADNPAGVNYFNNDGVANGFNDGYAVSGSTSFPSSTNPFTDVGAYFDAASPYGAFDMNGNVWEWNETLIGSSRGFRGGSWGGDEFFLRSSGRFDLDPTGEDNSVGFRLASPAIPAPSCPADWDGSGGQPNSSDFLAYLNDFSAQDPAADLAPPGSPSGDGSFDSSDFLAFLNLYAQGC